MADNGGIVSDGDGGRLAPLLPFVAIVELGIAVVITGLAKVPHPLPNIALGSPALFHLERIFAVLLVVTAVLTLFVATFNKRLPTSLNAGGAGLGYEKTVEGVVELDKAITAATKRVEVLEANNDEMFNVVSKMVGLFEKLDERTRRLQNWRIPPNKD